MSRVVRQITADGTYPDGCKRLKVQCHLSGLVQIYD